MLTSSFWDKMYIWRSVTWSLTSVATAIAKYGYWELDIPMIFVKFHVSSMLHLGIVVKNDFTQIDLWPLLSGLQGTTSHPGVPSHQILKKIGPPHLHGVFDTNLHLLNIFLIYLVTFDLFAMTNTFFLLHWISLLYVWSFISVGCFHMAIPWTMIFTKSDLWLLTFELSFR